VNLGVDGGWGPSRVVGTGSEHRTILPWRPAASARLLPYPVGRPDACQCRATPERAPAAAGALRRPDGAAAGLASVGTDRPRVYVTFETVFGNPVHLGAVLDGLEGIDADLVVTAGPDGDPSTAARGG
jgi:hypothetical protein